MSTVLPMVRPAPTGQNGSSQAGATVWVLHREADAVAQVKELAPVLHASVEAVRSLAEVRERADEHGWGCILVDYAAFRSDLQGQGAEFSEERPAYPLVVWSSQLDVPVSVEAMKLGAIDVLRKPADNGSLAGAVKNALRIGRERLLKWQESQTVLRHYEQLSDAEKAVLSLVLQGFTNKEIATQVDCSLRTVEARRQRILRTMQSENAIDLAVLLSRHGVMDRALEAPIAPPVESELQTNVS